MNTGQNRTSNRFRTGRNENRQETRRNQANFNEFLGPSGLACFATLREEWQNEWTSGYRIKSSNQRPN
jgi:hypothetical protein